MEKIETRYQTIYIPDNSMYFTVAELREYLYMLDPELDNEPITITSLTNENIIGLIVCGDTAGELKVSL